LEKLNKLIWPLILQEAKKEIENLFQKRRDIIVLEAAVLIQAKWQNECSEIWTCIIPQNEVNFFIIDKLYFVYVYVYYSDRNLFFIISFYIFYFIFTVFIIVDIT